MDIFAKPDPIDTDIVANLGPLAVLAGHWVGDQGIDRSPGAEGPVETAYREQATFEPVGPVVNGPQVLYGLRYTTVAWPQGEEDPFHEEVGYWLWDPAASQVMRCFMVPRGVTILAGGKADATSRRFDMEAQRGSEVFGILSNPFLDRGFQTIRYELSVEIDAEGRFTYEEDTIMKLAGDDAPFHHTDRNTLSKR